LPRWLRPAAALAGGCLAFGLLLFLLTSCSELPTRPGSEAAIPTDDLSTAASGGSHKWRVEQVVGGQGGTIQLDTNLDLVFPPGALAGEVLVSAEMKLNDKKGSATKLSFEFEPSMSFQAPVTLEIGSDYLAGTGTTYVLTYFNPDTRTWEEVDQQPIGFGASVTFLLDHFSQYSVTRRY
jgi:hypothetical protein